MTVDPSQLPEDIDALKQIIADRGSDVPVIAKLEKPQAIERLEEILEAAEGAHSAAPLRSVDSSSSLFEQSRWRLSGASGICSSTARPNRL